ncbi:C40 family peptidase [Reinekea forsetii]|nr:C40 family peptidase [Reinekea forsetii]
MKIFALVLTITFLQACSHEAVELTFEEKLKVLEYAETMIGVPYELGGQSFQGVDCSGLLILGMNSIGVKEFLNIDDEFVDDVNANELALFNAKLITEPERGDWIAFYDETGNYYHISIFDSYTSDSILVLDASSAGNDWVEYRVIENIKEKPHDFVVPVKYVH